MSFYRTILAAVAAIAIAAPVFADDTTTSTTTSTTVQSTDTAGTAGQTTASTDTATTTDAKVNLNKASAKELMKVKGLNASKARAIIAYRKAHGNFTSTNDLANVKGFKKIKPETMKQITDQLTIE